MPLVGGNRHFRVLELYPLSIHHSVKTEIVLERVGADNIVASWIAESEDQPHALVHFAGEGLGFYAHVYVRIFSLIGDQNRVSGVGRIGVRLLDDVLPARRAGHRLDQPFAGRLVAGRVGSEGGGWFRNRIRLEVGGDCFWESKRDRSGNRYREP